MKETTNKETTDKNTESCQRTNNKNKRNKQTKTSLNFSISNYLESIVFTKKQKKTESLESRGNLTFLTR